MKFVLNMRSEAENVPLKVARSSSSTSQVEGPVFLRESLQSGYTELHPKVVSSLGGSKGNNGSWFAGFEKYLGIHRQWAHLL